MGGHYNFSAIWGGLAGMKQAVQKVKNAGLKAGMHTLSGNIAKTDPYITPVPDDRLAKKAVNSLSAAVGAATTYLPLAQPTTKLPSPSGPHLYPAATDVQIGTEIISYGALNTSGLGAVKRGAYGTKPSAHPAGTTLYLLTQVYGGFLPDPSTNMIDEVASNIARAYNEAGFEMVYFDGLEGHSATGPFSAAMLHQSFFKFLKGDALVESSDSAGFNWHLNTRTGQTDWAATDRRVFLDYTKGPNMQSAHCSSLDTPDMGWWGYVLHVPGAYYSTTPDECEYMAARVVGWSASPNFETSVGAFDENGRTPDCLSRIKRWLTLSDRVPDSVRSALVAVNTDYHLEGEDTATKAYIRPGHFHAPRVADPHDSRSLKFALPSVYGDDHRLGLRLRALSAVPPNGNRTDVLQLSPDSGVVRNTACMAVGLNYSVVSDAPAGGPVSALRLAMTGKTTALTTQCVRNQFAAPMDLSNSRVLEVTIHGDGTGAVLDIQLQDASAGVREFFVNLTFVGWRTIRMTLPATRSLYTHAGGEIPWASHPGGNDNRAMRTFSWSKLLAVQFQLTNATEQTVSYVGEVVALAETAANTGSSATIRIGRSTLNLPPLRGGTQANDADYVECSDVMNVSSCIAYNSTNWPLPVVWSYAHTVTGKSIEHNNSDTTVEYKPVSETAARVEVSVFEWGSDEQLIGPF